MAEGTHIFRDQLGSRVANVTTAGQGFFIAAPENTLATTTAALASINQVRVAQFVLPFRMIVRTLVSEVTTLGGAGKKYGVGIYNVDKTLLVESGALDANTAAINATAVTATTMEPGTYYVAWTSDSTSTILRAVNTQIQSVLNQGTDTRMGAAANSGTAGVLPATLGVITTAGLAPARVVLLP